jgi:hypothetical protein
MALNLWRRDGSSRESLRRRKRRAVLNDASRWHLLFGDANPATTTSRDRPGFEDDRLALNAICV